MFGKFILRIKMSAQFYTIPVILIVTFAIYSICLKDSPQIFIYNGVIFVTKLLSTIIGEKIPRRTILNTSSINMINLRREPLIYEEKICQNIENVCGSIKSRRSKKVREINDYRHGNNGDHYDNVFLRVFERAKRLGIEKESFKNVYVCEKLRLIWCMVPKSGSTIIRKIIVGLLAGSPNNWTIIPDLNKKYFDSVISLGNLPPMKAARLLKSYKKFVFVRHPFDRLYSAYSDKIIGSEKYRVNLIHEHIKEHLGRQGNNMVNIRSLRQVNESKMADTLAWPSWARPLLTSFQSSGSKERKVDFPLKFSQFLIHVITKHKIYFPGQFMNPHWRSHESLCHPCLIHYDFVQSLERFSHRVKPFLSFLATTTGKGNQLIVPHDFRPNRALKSNGYKATKLIFSHLSKSLYQRVKQIYSSDFSLFNYTDEEYEPI